MELDFTGAFLHLQPSDLTQLKGPGSAALASDKDVRVAVVP